MDGTPNIALPVSHQDVVLKQPPRSRVLANCSFDSVAILEYEDQPAISFQCHPEFEPDYAAALIELRRAKLTNADAAIASLSRSNDRQRIAGWIGQFLTGS